MTKSQLIQRLAELNPNLYQRDVERIVNTIFDEITAALSRGDRVELRGFGSFSVRRRAARSPPVPPAPKSWTQATRGSLITGSCSVGDAQLIESVYTQV